MPTPSPIPVDCDFEELNESGSGEINVSSPSFVKRYATVQQDEDAAIARVQSFLDDAPSITIDDTEFFWLSYKVDCKGAIDDTLFLYIVEITYQFQVDYFEMSGDTTGATFKTLQALDVGNYYNLLADGDALAGLPLTPAGQGVGSFSGLIGVNGNNVEGVDVPIPKDEFTILIRTKFSTLPPNWIQDIQAVACKVNDSPLTLTFKGQDFTYDVEELLFLGLGNWRITSKDDFEGTLKFSVQRSQFVTIGLRADVFKQGWRYVWVRSERATNGARVVITPTVAVVNQVLNLGDLSILGIFS